jgi:hypothetical protein
MAVKPIPDGCHTVTPFLNVKGTAKLIDFLKNALGAEEVMRMPGPGWVVVHAEVNIGNSRLMLSEAMQGTPSSSSFYLYVNLCRYRVQTRGQCRCDLADCTYRSILGRPDGHHTRPIRKYLVDCHPHGRPISRGYHEADGRNES